jgi:hypothetical protein
MLQPKRRVDLKQLFLFMREEAREHEASAWCEARGDRGCERHKDAALDVRDDELERVFQRRDGALADLELLEHAIALCVLARGLHRLIVDVQPDSRLRTQEQGANRQDAASTADIEHAVIREDEVLKLREDKARRLMRTGAERLAWVERENHIARLGIEGLPRGLHHEVSSHAAGLKELAPLVLPLVAHDVDNARGEGRCLGDNARLIVIIEVRDKRDGADILGAIKRRPIALFHACRAKLKEERGDFIGLFRGDINVHGGIAGLSHLRELVAQTCDLVNEHQHAVT